MRRAAIMAALMGVVLWCSTARADPDAWMAPAAPAGTAESKLGEGFALVEKQDWSGAEAAFREAIRLRAAFPEAWNGLGHALRQQKKYEESVKSYEEALRLRPDYPQALEYLGEAYVEMGKVAAAREILGRLRALDPGEAGELAKAIDHAGK